MLILAFFLRVGAVWSVLYAPTVRKNRQETQVLLLTFCPVVVDTLVFCSA